MHLGTFTGEHLSRSHNEDPSPARDWCSLLSLICGIGGTVMMLVAVVGVGL